MTTSNKSSHQAEGRIRVASVRGHRVRIADYAPDIPQVGPPMLMLMGIGAPLEMWQPLEDELVARGRRMIACDMPGTGSSPPAVPPLRMPALAGIVAGVLDVLCEPQADVVGLSFGGLLAQQFAHSHPRRVRRLVLAATAPGLIGVPPPPHVLGHMITPVRYWNKDYAQRIAGTIYGGRARQNPKAALRGRFIKPPSGYGYASQLFAVAGWTALPWLRSVKQPTLVLAGDDDPIIPEVNTKMIADRIPNSRFHVFRGGGHLFLLEEPVASAELIHEFLS